MALLDKDRISELFSDNEDSQNRRRSLLLTVSIVATLTLLFTIFGFVTPLPLPAEEGSFVLVGYEDGDEDITEPIEEEPLEEIAEEAEEPKEVEEEVTEPIEEVAETEMETGDEEGAPEIDATEKPVEKPTEKPEEPVEEEPVEKEEVKPNVTDGLADLLKSKAKPKGEDVKNERKIGDVGIGYKKTSFGSVGIFEGTGVDLVNMPDIEEKTQENADVYIIVTVDSDGRVISVKPDLKKTTTTNSSLIKKSEENAKRSTFKRTDKTGLVKVVTLEYKYRLQ